MRHAGRTLPPIRLRLWLVTPSLFSGLLIRRLTVELRNYHITDDGEAENRMALTLILYRGVIGRVVQNSIRRGYEFCYEF